MLEELNLDFCPSMQSWQFAGFMRSDGEPMALRKIGLSCCTSLEGATLQQLSETCPGLESIGLRLCDQKALTPESVSRTLPIHTWEFYWALTYLSRHLLLRLGCYSFEGLPIDQSNRSYGLQSDQR